MFHQPHKKPKPFTEDEAYQYDHLGDRVIETPTFDKAAAAVGASDPLALSDAEFERQYQLLGAADRDFDRKFGEAAIAGAAVATRPALPAAARPAERPTFGDAYSRRTGTNADLWPREETVE